MVNEWVYEWYVRSVVWMMMVSGLGLRARTRLVGA